MSNTNGRERRERLVNERARTTDRTSEAGRQIRVVWRWIVNGFDRARQLAAKFRSTVEPFYGSAAPASWIPKQISEIEDKERNAKVTGWLGLAAEAALGIFLGVVIFQMSVWASMALAAITVGSALYLERYLENRVRTDRTSIGFIERVLGISTVVILLALVVALLARAGLVPAELVALGLTVLTVATIVATASLFALAAAYSRIRRLWEEFGELEEEIEDWIEEYYALLEFLPESREAYEADLDDLVTVYREEIGALRVTRRGIDVRKVLGGTAATCLVLGLLSSDAAGSAFLERVCASVDKSKSLDSTETQHVLARLGTVIDTLVDEVEPVRLELRTWTDERSATSLNGEIQLDLPQPPDKGLKYEITSGYAERLRAARRRHERQRLQKPVLEAFKRALATARAGHCQPGSCVKSAIRRARGLEATISFVVTDAANSCGTADSGLVMSGHGLVCVIVVPSATDRDVERSVLERCRNLRAAVGPGIAVLPYTELDSVGRFLQQLRTLTARAQTTRRDLGLADPDRNN